MITEKQEFSVSTRSWKGRFAIQKLKLSRITEKDWRDITYHPVFEETRKTLL